MCVTEGAPESCCGSGLGLWFPFMCLSLPSPLIGQSRWASSVWDPALPLLCLVHPLSPASCLPSPKHLCSVLSLFLCC